VVSHESPLYLPSPCGGVKFGRTKDLAEDLAESLLNQRAGAKVLKELIQHHVKEEESTFWSDARDNFSTDERKLMNQKYLAVKKKVAVR